MRKTLLSFFTKVMFVCAFVLFSQSSFSQIFRFDFENSTNVTSETAVGTPTFTANGVTNAGYSTTNPCLNLRLRSAENWDTGDYYRFNVNTTGYGNMVFSLCGRADATTIGTFLIRGSADNGVNWVTLVSTFTPGTTNGTVSSIVFPESLSNQAAVIIELYKVNDANSNSRVLYIDNAVLTGNPTPLVTSFTPAGPVCTGTNITITGTNFTGATGVSINGTAVSSFTVNSATSITATIAPGTTAGTVQVSNDYGYGTSAASLTFNPSPSAVTATPSANVICTGSTVNLTASANSNVTTPTTILTQNFNAATNNWIKVNNSTGGTVVNAAWTLRPNNYNPSQAISSNDATQFYLSNSDAQGNNTTTATILQSPSFSTVGLASASLNFYHYFRYNDGETARVRVSTDGTNWDTLETYESTQGARNNFALGTFSLNGYLGQATVYVRFEYNATYDWYWAIDNVTISGTTPVAPTYTWTSTPAGFTSNVQNPTNVAPTVTTSYTVTATNSYGCTTTATTTVTVNPTSVAGAVSANQTICSGSQPANITIGASTGTIQWQSSTDNNTFNNIAGQTTNTLSGATIGNLTATRYYRAVVTSGVCAAANSAVVTVTVNPTSVAGAVSANQAICSGSQPANITIGASTGTIQWQSSTDNNTFNNIGGQTTNTLSGATIGNLTATRYYRAVVTSGVCAAANSAVVTVTVSATSAAGAVSANQTICSGSQPADLTIGSSTGSIQWQSSTDNNTFNNIGGQTGNTLPGSAMGNLTATRYYRAVVTSGVCAAANSAVVTVTVNPTSVAGAVSGNQVICSGSQPANITIGTSTGTIQWQSSTDNNTFNNIGGQTANTLSGATIGNLTATRYYRAVVTSGVCTSATSSVVTVMVDPASVGGTVSGSTTVCAAANGGSLTLSGHVGNVTKWQSSDVSDFSVGVLDIPNTSTTLSYVNLAATTYYRAVVTSGVCGSANSSVAVVNVDNVAVGGSVNGSATVCYGNNGGSLTLSGYTGTITGWQSSLDNFATAGTPINNTTTTQNYSNLTATTSYRAVIASGTCPAVYSAAATITANINSVWTGANSTSWTDAANWSCGVVPTTDIHVTISAVTNQPIVSAAAFANTLTMETGTTLTVQSGSSLTVEDVINGQGTAVLTVENNANLIQVNDVDNTINAVVKKTTNPLMRLDYILWSSPVAGQNLLGFSPATNTNRFYIYNPSTDLYNTVVPSSTSFAEGTGYLIRMPNTHPTTPTVWNGTFSGVLNNGDVDIAVANNTYNAVGNPYASAIDADLFISENSLTEALYFWRKTNNDQTTSYATYTTAGGVGTSSNGGGDPMLLTPDGTIMPGQGFIARSTSGTLSFNNSMRTDSNGQFFRTNQIERNRIWLNLTNASGIFSQTMVSYMTGATQDVDATIDGLYFNDSQLALTSMIGENEYAIQGRALPFANTDVVPLGFKAIDAGTYTIGLDHADGLFADVSQPIFLKDNNDGSIHDLRLGNYTFASEAGSFNGRFELVYQNMLGVNNPVWDANQVVVYKSGQEIVVNTGRVTMDQVKVFDIRGRLITSKDKVRASETKLFAGTANQVLIVKIVSEGGKEVTRKIVN
ncbi:T9SS sorting signal type C domain-containing protein [Flavobacterium sp.]|uniref:T9SS sorting signal type C domain-containing protein n=1 Tax=Flavobacterium sp. TaxID=239 RepID=UPI0039E3114E